MLPRVPQKVTVYVMRVGTPVLGLSYWELVT